MRNCSAFWAKTHGTVRGKGKLKSIFKVMPFARCLLIALMILSSIAVFFPRSTEVLGLDQSSGLSNSSLVATVKVGNFPTGIAFDSLTGNIYVANSQSNTVSVISGSSDAVISNVTVGSYPIGVALDSRNGNVYVTNLDSDTVSVINGTTNTVINTIDVGNPGNDPFGITFNSNNGNLYVANAYVGCSLAPSNSVSVINGSTNAVVDNITVGPNLQGVAFDQSNGNVYVTSSCSSAVYVIGGPTNTVIDTIVTPSPAGPFGVTFDPANKCIYVSSYFLYQINGTTNMVIGNLSLGGNPSGMAYDATNGYLYVSDLGSNNASVVNPTSLTKVAQLSAAYSWDVEYDSSNTYLYFSNSGANTVSVIASEFYSTTTSQYDSSSSSSSSSSGFTTPVVTPSGGKVEITVTGTVSPSQISNMALSENSSSNQFILSFTTTGASGTATLTIPKNAIPEGYTPLVYTNGSLSGGQAYYSDQNNYYVTFALQAGTHEVSIVFSGSSSSTTGSSSSSLPPPVNISSYEIIAVASVIIVAAGSFVLIRRHH